MVTYIGIAVTVLLVIELMGVFGFRNGRARNELAKKIAEELHELQKTEALKSRLR